MSGEPITLLFHADGTPGVWYRDGCLYDGNGYVEPCDAWGYFDCDDFDGSINMDADVVGLLRAAAKVCDDRCGGQCGCGLLYGKVTYYRRREAPGD